MMRGKAHRWGQWKGNWVEALPPPSHNDYLRRYVVALYFVASSARINCYNLNGTAVATHVTICRIASSADRVARDLVVCADFQDPGLITLGNAARSCCGRALQISRARYYRVA